MLIWETEWILVLFAQENASNSILFMEKNDWLSGMGNYFWQIFKLTTKYGLLS